MKSMHKKRSQKLKILMIFQKFAMQKISAQSLFIDKDFDNQENLKMLRKTSWKMSFH